MLTQAAPEIDYPSSDGRPLAENTKQARWITILFSGLSAWFRHRLDVFVAMDLLWYTVRGDNGDGNRTAPDVFVVFGRPKGDRMCYLQWEEGGVAPQVVFEILSPGNRPDEMARKFILYEEHGVEEYYLYDPDTNALQVWRRGRTGAALVRERFCGSYTSPLLGIRFDLTGEEMVVYHPDGRPYLTPEAAEDERVEIVRRAEEAEADRAIARRAAEDARRAVDDATVRLADEQQGRWQAEARLGRVVELGRKARQGTASPEEIAELDRLEAGE